MKNQLELHRDNYNNADNLLKEGIICEKELEILKDRYLKYEEAYELLLKEKDKDIYDKPIKYFKPETQSNDTDCKINELENNYQQMLKLYNEGIISKSELNEAKIEYQVTSIISDEKYRTFSNNLIFERLENPFNLVIKTSLKFVTSLFGYRIHPITGLYSLHGGIDIAVPEGTPVYSYNDGQVKRSTYGEKAGNFVEISHGSGYSSLYLHLSKYVVSPGQFVKQGELIGYVGSTGLSTGSHLHFEIRKDNKSIDINYLVK